MSRPWRNGRPASFWVGLALLFLLLSGVGTVFGLRARAIALTAHEVQKLREEQAKVQAEIEKLRFELAQAATPKVVEQKAREVLRWVYPDEELVILIRRR
jgi:cell division protein FtsB